MMFMLHTMMRFTSVKQLSPVRSVIKSVAVLLNTTVISQSISSNQNQVVPRRKPLQRSTIALLFINLFLVFSSKMVAVILESLVKRLMTVKMALEDQTASSAISVARR